MITGRFFAALKMTEAHFAPTTSQDRLTRDGRPDAGRSKVPGARPVSTAHRRYLGTPIYFDIEA